MPTGGGPATHRPAGGRHHLQVVLDHSVTDDWTWADAKPCDRRAFLRGSLLNASISMGAAGTHVEFVLPDAPQAIELRARLRSVGVRGGVLRRRGRAVVYLKGQEEVATLLRLTGANRALLDFEAGRVARDVRNRLNRLLNAEEANVDRTVRAADRQLQAIAQLAGAGELERLPEGLREAAARRRAQPDADLDTLASALGISRSAVNHRLRRLVALAADLRSEDH
jgi:DNA-binding protein WhiA